MESSKNMSDRERLIRLEEQVDARFNLIDNALREQRTLMTNHLSHHERTEILQLEREKENSKMVERRQEKTSDRVFKITLLLLNLISTGILTFVFAYYKITQ